MAELKCPRCSYTVPPDDLAGGTSVCPRCALHAGKAVPLLRSPAAQRLQVRALGEANQAIVLEAEGELDLSTASRLREPLLDKLDHARTVVVDLSEVSFIDSSGIAVLVEAWHSLDIEDPPALQVVVARGSQVERVFTLSGLERVLSIFGNREEALGAPSRSS